MPVVCYGSPSKTEEKLVSQFQLFDAVKLKSEIPLEDGGTAPEGCMGSIVEVFNDGEAYMVELFGGWVVDRRTRSATGTG